MLPLLSADQAGELLGVTTRTLHTLSKKGELPCIKMGRRVKYDQRDIEGYVNRCRTQKKEVQTAIEILQKMQAEVSHG